jgi:DNA polymerase
MSIADLRWDERQRGLLQAMGLDLGLDLARPAAQAQLAVQAAPLRRAEPSPAAAPVLAPSSIEKAAAPAVTADLQHLDLDGLHAAVRACKACGLCEHRKQAVPGIGHAQAHWMVIGEGPGEQEDLQGEPFVGPSGRLLDAMLAAVGRTRQQAPAAQQVFIANSVKCRPPGNRNPSPEELAACVPFLQRQLALVKPRVVLALGRFAAQSLLGSEAPIGRLRGTVHRLGDGTPVVVSYHPAYLLRQPQEKARAWEDLCLAADVADAAQAMP